MAWARNDDVAAALSLLLDRGPLHRFFGLDPVKRVPPPEVVPVAACDVVRRQAVLEPTITAEQNPLALPGYFTIRSFEPRPDGDFLRLDNVLDRLSEPAAVEVCLEPSDIAAQRSAHTLYLKRLQQINHPWDVDDDELVHEDSGDTVGSWRLALKPLRTKDRLAEDIIRLQRRFHETLTQPHVRFHIRVFAQTAAVARVLASVVAESAFENGSYQLVDSVSGGPLVQQSSLINGDLRVVPTDGLKEVLREQRVALYDGFDELANRAPADELFGVFRLPVTSGDSPRCIRKTTDPPRDDPDDLIVLGYDARNGDNGQLTTAKIARGIPVKNLAKHALLGGMPGSGKTSSAFSLLVQLAARGIPFIVFESGKSEYRVLKCLKDHPDPQVRRLAQRLQLYTPGSDTSPLRLNPLNVCPGIHKNEHIENLLACFNAAMPMVGPLPMLLTEGLERVYWNQATTGRQPRMASVYPAARQVLSSKGYSAEVDSNIGGAQDTRFSRVTRRSIGQVFQCDRDIPSLEQLMAGHSVVELMSLPRDEACLLITFLLTSIYERVKCSAWSGAARG